MFYICKWVFKKEEIALQFQYRLLNRCYFITKLLLFYFYKTIITLFLLIPVLIINTIF